MTHLKLSSSSQRRQSLRKANHSGLFPTLRAASALLLVLFTSTAFAQQKSQRNTSMFTTLFENHTIHTVDAYWVDFNGQERFQHSIEPFKSLTRDVGARHYWRFKIKNQTVGTYFTKTRNDQKFVIVNSGDPRTVKSPRGTSAVDFSIVNSEQKSYSLYWTDFDGNLIYIKTLPAGATMVRKAGVGHTWVPRDPRGGWTRPIKVAPNGQNQHQIREYDITL